MRLRGSRRWIVRGNAARDSRQWPRAAHCYAAALAIDPANPAIHVQHGHALKECGDLDGAERCYRAALARAPRDADSWLQLGHVLKLQGRAADATLAYRESLLLSADLPGSARELRDLGAADRIPPAARDAVLGELADTLDRATTRLVESAALVGTATCYDDFRHGAPVQAPPRSAERAQLGTVLVHVDGRGRTAAEIRVTVAALLDQADSGWRARVLVDEAMMAHPVVGIAAVDPRVAFVTEAAAETPRAAALFLVAGTALDPQAIAWFLFALITTGCAAAYPDHDLAVDSWRARRRYAAPALQPAFDPDWFGEGLTPPAAIMVRADMIGLVGGHAGLDLCAVAAAGGQVLHIPRLLASCVDVTQGARNAPADAPADRPAIAPVPALPRCVSAAGQEVISVVIPTRDHAGLLQKAVATLYARAAQPRRLELVVVDNRSVQRRTLTVLERLRRLHDARIVAMDEPFNWSRANNLAVKAAATGRLLLFLNNDTEMLSEGWDDLLRARLARDEIGIVGVRLLYPDRTLQHGGVVFGTDSGAPRHEGVGAAEGDGGPLGRWLRVRSVAAVTGAFMAMRHATWEEVGGFDELMLPIGYNDVDMCLRVRAAGRRVLYEPAICAIHHESKTRGFNVTRSQVAWDQAELRTLHQRWDAALFDDPTLNPHWSRRDMPFARFRDPPLSEVLDYLARQHPTAPAQRAEHRASRPAA